MKLKKTTKPKLNIASETIIKLQKIQKERLKEERREKRWALGEVMNKVMLLLFAITILVTATLSWFNSGINPNTYEVSILHSPVTIEVQKYNTQTGQYETETICEYITRDQNKIILTIPEIPLYWVKGVLSPDFTDTEAYYKITIFANFDNPTFVDTHPPVFNMMYTYSAVFDEHAPSLEPLSKLPIFDLDYLIWNYDPTPPPPPPMLASPPNAYFPKNGFTPFQQKVINPNTWPISVDTVGGNVKISQIGDPYGTTAATEPQTSISDPSATMPSETIPSGTEPSGTNKFHQTIESTVYIKILPVTGAAYTALLNEIKLISIGEGYIDYSLTLDFGYKTTPFYTPPTTTQ